MSWRVHLANSAIHALHVLPTPRPMLAAWTRPDHVELFDMADGSRLEERTLPPAPRGRYNARVWEAYVAALAVSAHHWLPNVTTPDYTLLLTDDGRARLYWDHERSLTLVDEGNRFSLDTDGARHFVALDFDRELGTTLALADDGRVHLFQQEDKLGVFEVGLAPSADRRAAVAIASGGQTLFVSDGQRLVVLNHNGRVIKQLDTHYEISLMACSPDGQVLGLTDNENGVLRLYRGQDLLLTHQKFAIDLIATARRSQLLEEMPPLTTAVNSIALYTAGTVVFAMGGVICATHADDFNRLPNVRASF